MKLYDNHEIMNKPLKTKEENFDFKCNSHFIY